MISSRKIGFNDNQPVIRIMFFLLLVMTMSACTPNFDDLTVQDLERQGYCLYILPDELVADRQWERSIRMNSFDYHCSQGSADSYWNPIDIHYAVGFRDIPLVIRISPQDAIFNMSAEKNSISIDVNWIPSKEAIYYTTDENGLVVKIKDNNNLDVIIATWLSLEEIVHIIENLQRVGDNDDGENPWTRVCQQ